MFSKINFISHISFYIYLKFEIISFGDLYRLSKIKIFFINNYVVLFLEIKAIDTIRSIPIIQPIII